MNTKVLEKCLEKIAAFHRRLGVLMMVLVSPEIIANITVKA